MSDEVLDDSEHLWLHRDEYTVAPDLDAIEIDFASPERDHHAIECCTGRPSVRMSYGK